MEVRPKDAEEVLRARSSQHEVFTKYKKHIGFNTSGTGVTSRSDLYSTTLIGSLKYTAKVTRDSRLVNQISSLTERNGRIDHASGGNDDLVIGALLSYFVLTKGKNLSYYGIDVRSIMKGNELYLTERYSVNEKGYTKEEMVLKEGKFNELLEIFGSERDPIYSRQLEIQIKKIAGEMSVGGSVLSVEELLEDIKRDKKLKRNY